MHFCGFVEAAIPTVSAAAAFLLPSGPRSLSRGPGGFTALCASQQPSSAPQLGWSSSVADWLAGSVRAVRAVSSRTPAAGNVCPAAAEARRRSNGRRGVPRRLVSPPQTLLPPAPLSHSNLAQHPDLRACASMSAPGAQHCIFFALHCPARVCTHGSLTYFSVALCSLAMACCCLVGEGPLLT